VEAFFEPHSSATGRKKSLHWGEKMFLGASKEFLNNFKDLDYEVFDVRANGELPNIDDFDLFISSGGPGSPLDGDGVWDTAFFNFLDRLWEHNLNGVGPRKFVFFICHSFQMACDHFGLGSITRRKSMSFGTFPVHLTDAGASDPIFKNLPNPFTVADFRDWQLVQPDLERFEEMGAQILALEKIRPHVPYERAIMAVRFSEEMFGVQFHPEADDRGMLRHFQLEKRVVHVINEHGKDKFAQMMRDLNDPEKIKLTHQTVLPNFLIQSMVALKQEFAPA
jgi:homoserine O-succinyltransferase